MDRWIKTTSLAAFAAALGLFALTADSRAEGVPPTHAPPVVESELPAPDPVEAEPTCSPPSQCTTNKSCDRICGRGQGVCVRINSCYSECSCSSAL